MTDQEHTQLISSLCTQKQLESSTFQYWAKRLGEQPDRLHRKIWEYSFISQALYERGLLAPSRTGLGFGVGKEPLASLFCSYEVKICATDAPFEVADKGNWVETGQFADGLEVLNERNLCPQAKFEQLCTYRKVDMNSIPDDLRGFDFVWSSCALEHLGSIQDGEEFIYNSLDCIKARGYAVHTTEFNISSNDGTLTSGNTVLYRKKDIERIVHNLNKAGHEIEVDYSDGKLPADRFIAEYPWDTDHLKLKIFDFVSTSIGLIVRKAG